MKVSELLLNASLEELKRGFLEEEDQYVCVCCGEIVEKGIIYPYAGILYEAGRFIRLHIEQEHGSAFDFLLSLDKGITGLSEVQKRLLALFYQGKSDAEVQKELGIGSTSTIRNHRFVLREKERQARAFLAVMELNRAHDPKPKEAATAPLKVSVSAAGETEGEETGVLQKYFVQGAEGPLRSFPVKVKHKRMVLAELAKRFEYGRMYSETEVNDILDEAFGDYALLRRSLIDYGQLSREADGSSYWRIAQDIGGLQAMTRREELKQLAKETKIEGGIFQIKNNRNGKVWVESTRNFKTMNGHEFSLGMNSHMNKELQQEWNEFGSETFEFEVLERLEKKESGFFDEKDALKKLKVKWLKKLTPYGDQGYNAPQEEERP